MAGGAGGAGRLVGLEVEAELEVVGQQLVRGRLVLVQQDVLVVAAAQPALGDEQGQRKQKTIS